MPGEFVDFTVHFEAKGQYVSNHQQALLILNKLKALKNRGYTKIGITFSTNNQMGKKIISDWDNAKKELQQDSGSQGHAAVIRELLLLLSKPENKEYLDTLAIIPIATTKTPIIETGVGCEMLQQNDSIIQENITYAQQFLSEEKHLLLGWQNQTTQPEAPYAVGGKAVALGFLSKENHDLIQKNFLDLKKSFPPKKMASHIKTTIAAYIALDPNAYPSKQNEHDYNPSDTFLQNPISKAIYEKRIIFSAEERAVLEESKNNVKLLITEQDLIILNKYFANRKNQNSPLGALYRTLSFEQFILRLYNKRYDMIYIDGRVIYDRSGLSLLESLSAQHNYSVTQNFLDNLHEQNKQILSEYICLEEMCLSPLVLPSITTITIGTGNRAERWQVIDEFHQSLDENNITYPVGVEARNGYTAHIDLLCVSIVTSSEFLSSNPSLEKTCKTYQQARKEKCQRNPALMETLTSLFGERHGLNIPADQFSNQELLVLQPEIIKDKAGVPHSYPLNRSIIKAAYVYRTKKMLIQDLLAQDAAARQGNLGKTLQVKGAGLGAFGFNDPINQRALEQLFRQALKEALQEITLTHVNRLNLINLPSTFGNPHFNEKFHETQEFDSSTNPTLRCYEANVDPLKNIPGNEDVGGSFACGDAGSLFGNEGLRGIFRQSSDDPATLYCFIDPSIVHPSYNTAWSNPQCIHIVKNNTLLPFADYAADPSNHEILNMNYSVPDHSPISSSNEATGIPVVPGWSMHGSTGDRSPSEAEILEAITNCVTMAAVEYHRVPGSLRERHGEKGEERAQALKEKFSAIQTLSAINKELAILFEEKGLFDFRSKGNYHEGSLKTLVLKKLKANDIAKNYIWAKPESNHSELPKDQAGREACAASSNILRPKKK